MGGGAIDTGGGGGKKKKRALDATINVVPAIDLLSCCIAFLLITAVWTQISKLQVQQSGGPSDGQTPPDPKALVLNVTMTEKGFVLTTGTAPPVDIPALGRNAENLPNYDFRALEAKLKQIKVDFQDQSTLTLGAEDGVVYNELVRVIDLCIGVGLPNVSITAA